MIHRLRPATDRTASTVPGPALPDGWCAVEVAGVERPVAIGPGGVFVLLHRFHTSRSIGLADPSPWPDRRHRMSTPQVTAELAAQLLAARCGLHVDVRPVVVVDVADALLLERPDGVHVVHRDHLAWWLDHQERVLSPELIARLVDACAPTPLPPAA